MILISEFMDEMAVKKLKERHKVIYDPSLVLTQSLIPKFIKESQAIIVRNKTLVTRELMEVAPKLLCVGRLGVGLDNIDMQACKENKITVYPATGANANSVAEYVICTAMILLRGAFQKNVDMLAGRWPREESSGLEVHGKTLGLIGFGEIAQRTKTVAKPLGMKIVAYDPHIDPNHNVWKGTENLSLDEVLNVSDVISLHVPFTKLTRKLIDEAKLRLIKPSSILINTARGGIVDEEALANALKEGRIGGAALDVFSKEPLNTEHAKLFEGLSNIILTPHIAGVTKESNHRVSDLIATKIDQHLSGI